jgi:chromosome segregation ATPase
MWSSIARAAAPPPPSSAALSLQQQQSCEEDVVENNGDDDAWEENDDDLLFDDDDDDVKEVSALTTMGDDTNVPDNKMKDDILITTTEPVIPDFGAALLAFVDNNGDGDEREAVHERNKGSESSSSGGGGGFGRGFVLQGLSRFIEAATAPQQQQDDEEEDEYNDDDEEVDVQGNNDDDSYDDDYNNDDDDNNENNNDGWDDDADFDMNDISIDDVNISNDEYDANYNSSQYKTTNTLDETLAAAAAMPSHNDKIPITEINNSIDDHDHDNNEGKLLCDKNNMLSNNTLPSPWQQPTSRDGLIIEENSLLDSGMKSTTTDGIPDSIKEFVTNAETTLELEFTKNAWKTPPPKSVRGAVSGNQSTPFSDDQPSTVSRRSIFEILTSPEKVEQQQQQQQEQQLVEEDECGEEEEGDDLSKSLTDFVKNLDTELTNFTTRNNVDDDDVGVNNHVLNHLPMSTQDMLEQTELQFKDMDMIIPLPNNDTSTCDEKKMEHLESGIGYKTLPDGTTVLVNYELLLQKEATKRILFQRSVQTYEDALHSLQSKHQLSMKLAQEQESQLTMANNEITQLRGLVFRLQDEKENIINNQQSYDVELAAAMNDKEYLEREVETIQEDLKVKEEICERNAELQRNFEVLLQHSDTERTRLTNQVEKLLMDTLVLQEERDQLHSQVKELTSTIVTDSHTASSTESLQLEVDRLNTQVNELLTKEASSSARLDEYDSLRESFTSLQEEMNSTLSMLSMLQDENESLRSVQREYEGQISELQATVESIDNDSSEANRLAAEMAALKYELGAKSSECDDSLVALQTLQTKLENAEARLGEVKDVEARLTDCCRSLESQKADLHNELEDSASTIQHLKSQVETLNELEIKVAILDEERSMLRISLEDKSTELEHASALVESLQSELNAHHHTPEEGIHSTEIDQSLKEENSELCKELDDLRGKCCILESQKLDLERSLVEKSNKLQILETQIENLNANVSQSSQLQSELSRTRQTLDDKVSECKIMTISCQQLRTELLDTQNEREVLIAKYQDGAIQSQEQISTLQSQIADLLEDHNSTMVSLEEQLNSTMQQNNELQSRCEDLSSRLKAAENECSNIAMSKIDSDAKYSDEIANLRIENLSLSTTIQEVQSTLEVKNHKTSADDAEIKQLHQIMGVLKEELASITRSHQELSDVNERLLREKTEIMNSIESSASDAIHQAQVMNEELNKLHADLAITENERMIATQTIADLTEQVQYLTDSKTELEEKLFDSSDKLEIDRLVNENASLRNEKIQLEEENHELEERIVELSSRIETSIASSDGVFTHDEKEGLLDRIRMLEDQLKSENLDELRDELSTLHEERHHLDLDNEELLVQLGLMQQGKIEIEAEREIELDTLREQVMNLQDQCSRLQHDLDESIRNSSSIKDDDQSSSTKTLKDENVSLRQAVDDVSRENRSLRDRISHLVLLEEKKVLQAARNSDDDSEVKELHQKLSLLELKLAKKEEEVLKLVNACSLNDSRLKETTAALAVKTDEMIAFNIQLESLQSKFQQQQHHVVGPDTCDDTREEEKNYEDDDDDDDDDISLQDLLAEASLDSDDYLRSQIVVLAQALQRSELQRADALERIFTERKVNADALCRLGESVKRYYSTVK